MLDLGGGLAIPYTDDDDAPDLRAAAAATVAAVAERFDPPPELLLEPGRSVVGTCGVTLYTVGAVKTAGGVTYVAVDGGMSDNPRPVLYGARYQAWIADRAGDEPDGTYAVRRKALRVRRRPDRGDAAVRRRGRATSSPSPPPAPTRPAWRRTTTASRGRRRSSSETATARTVVRRETVADLLAAQIG